MNSGAKLNEIKYIEQLEPNNEVCSKKDVKALRSSQLRLGEQLLLNSDVRRVTYCN